MTVGITTLRLLQAPGTYETLERKAAMLAEGIASAAQEARVDIYQTRVGSMFCTFFARQKVVDWPTARSADTAAFGRFFGSMLRQGVYLAPSQFEAGFMSLAHTDDDIRFTTGAAATAMREARA
jgi:glutamate-1-semialdehyde 2,1-aminomutase